GAEGDLPAGVDAPPAAPPLSQEAELAAVEIVPRVKAVGNQNAVAAEAGDARLNPDSFRDVQPFVQLQVPEAAQQVEPPTATLPDRLAGVQLDAPELDRCVNGDGTLCQAGAGEHFGELGAGVDIEKWPGQHREAVRGGGEVNRVVGEVEKRRFQRPVLARTKPAADREPAARLHAAIHHAAAE